MEASIVDLRYKMKGILKSLERNEDVKIYYHNTWVGTIVPKQQKPTKKRVKEHPFFGMHADEKESVEEHMERLRGGRYP
ncbi:MAG: type II toxin-antitoxin system Phd/YefM family antitoxin [Verrucomicrobia bacterium]|nr:type II toxin-antitoxin system Phd/YefM family antitoxin [Verrucomicrobiota bacterium]